MPKMTAKDPIAQILDENNTPISNEYEEEYSITHKPIIKGYITDKELYGKFAC